MIYPVFFVVSKYNNEYGNNSDYFKSPGFLIPSRGDHQFEYSASQPSDDVTYYDMLNETLHLTKNYIYSTSAFAAPIKNKIPDDFLPVVNPDGVYYIHKEYYTDPEFLSEFNFFAEPIKKALAERENKQKEQDTPPENKDNENNSGGTSNSNQDNSSSNENQTSPADDKKFDEFYDYSYVMPMLPKFDINQKVFFKPLRSKFTVTDNKVFLNKDGTYTYCYRLDNVFYAFQKDLIVVWESSDV